MLGYKERSLLKARNAKLGGREMEDSTNEVEISKEKPKQTKTETQSKEGYLSNYRLMSNAKAVETMKILSRHTVHCLDHSTQNK